VQALVLEKEYLIESIRQRVALVVLELPITDRHVLADTGIVLS
jgi:hypothetical protein